MRKILLAVALALPLTAVSQVCPDGQVWNACNSGFGPCIPGCAPVYPSVEPTGDSELCLIDTCSPVRYSWLGDFVIAESALPNGYKTLGWAGPCLSATHAGCPDILNQAFRDLRNNADRFIRAQSY